MAELTDTELTDAELTQTTTSQYIHSRRFMSCTHDTQDLANYEYKPYSEDGHRM